MRSPTRASKFGRMLAYARPEWRGIAVVFALTALYSALAALQPWPLKILIDYGLASAALPSWLQETLAVNGVSASPIMIVVAAALAGILVSVATAVVDAALTLAWSRSGQRMVYRLATGLFFHLQRLSLIFHARRSVGDALSRVTGDAWSVYAVTENTLLAPLRHGLVLASVGLLAWHLSPPLTAVLLTTVPLLTVSMLYFGKRLRGADTIRREAQARLTGFVHQALGAIPVVQAFGAAGRNLRVFGNVGEEVVRAREKGAVLTQSYSALNAVATTIAVAVVVYLGGHKVLAHEMTLGTLVVFLAYARSLEGACRGLLQTYGALRTAEAGVDRVLEILDARDVVAESPRAKPLPPRKKPHAGRIVLENVTFGYEADRPVLQDLNLEIGAGETLALVGSSGAGKTTIAALVPRLFDPWRGRVLLDGMDVREVELASLRGEIGLVLQDPFLLPISIVENISYGRPDASRDDVVAAAVAANAHEFIRQLPDGYETVLGESGATLSGGQQQRLAIARALLKDPRVLILDEPTASLDAQTERLVMQALERLMVGRTTLIIAHRLTTVRGADRIAVIDGGRIVELGTHAELLGTGGRYAHLYALSAFGTGPEPLR
jgi:ATP-binding cassette subfamily B protein